MEELHDFFKSFDGVQRRPKQYEYEPVHNQQNLQNLFSRNRFGKMIFLSDAPAWAEPVKVPPVRGDTISSASWRLTMFRSL